MEIRAPLSEQIAEALKAYGGPRDPAAVMAYATNRAAQRATQERAIRVGQMKARIAWIDAEMARLEEKRLKREEQIKLSLLEEARETLAQSAERVANLAGRAKRRAIVRFCAHRFGFTFVDMISSRRKRPLVPRASADNVGVLESDGPLVPRDRPRLWRSGSYDGDVGRWS